MIVIDLEALRRAYVLAHRAWTACPCPAHEAEETQAWRSYWAALRARFGWDIGQITEHIADA